MLKKINLIKMVKCSKKSHLASHSKQALLLLTLMQINSNGSKYCAVQYTCTKLVLGHYMY